ncbi:metallophosphoesterase [Bacillus sp. 31A1R]|uniref:Metallophosphoesterase n=1 Tax=Robertmurraya mangrovi TaxID=3098077 RepID=A0ABU5J0J0_9BACI|nr:metallophosphoesterase [Bacillus sp. 31A1R]MDZ5472867.1 metallophosphoesterase [Bacillus sp. 31A1R]
MLDVRSLTLDKTKRIIVTSDIHANLELFKKLLNKVNFTEDDYLFINGDLCEKGPNSLEVVEYVRNLMTVNQNVFLTKGNCDVVFRYVFNNLQGIIPYMKRQPYSILNEMINIYGKTIDDFADLKELSKFYRENFGELIDWLESLPNAYETEDFIIVHAALENINDWKETKDEYSLYTYAFGESEHQANKNVIVGHWPVVNYRATDISSHNPLIDLNKRIISIDGGNQIKPDGQLNALIFENGEYSFTFVDELTKEMMIPEDFEDTTGRKGTVTYPNYEINILEREKFFTLCENKNLAIKQWIKNEYLSEEGEKVVCKDDLSTTFLSVSKGERVKVVDDQCEGYTLVKKQTGEIGWVPKM